MLLGKRRRSPHIRKQEVVFRLSDSNELSVPLVLMVHSFSSSSSHSKKRYLYSGQQVLWIFRNPRNWLTESLITLITWMELDTYLAWSNYEATPHNILLLLPSRLLGGGLAGEERDWNDTFPPHWLSRGFLSTRHTVLETRWLGFWYLDTVRFVRFRP